MAHLVRGALVDGPGLSVEVAHAWHHEDKRGRQPDASEHDETDNRLQYTTYCGMPEE